MTETRTYPADLRGGGPLDGVSDVPRPFSGHYRNRIFVRGVAVIPQHIPGAAAYELEECRFWTRPVYRFIGYLEQP